jgi:hypothetical protein
MEPYGNHRSASQDSATRPDTGCTRSSATNANSPGIRGRQVSPRDPQSPPTSSVPLDPTAKSQQATRENTPSPSCYEPRVCYFSTPSGGSHRLVRRAHIPRHIRRSQIALGRTDPSMFEAFRSPQITRVSEHLSPFYAGSHFYVI